jgi:hypothetical protein
LKSAPEIAVGDGALGFWKALDEIFPGTKHQRCFRNGPPGVKSPVSASPSFAALRERAPRNCAVASAALLLGFRRRRRRSLASVRGRHEDRHTMPSEETVSPSGWRGPSDDGQHAMLRPEDLIWSFVVNAPWQFTTAGARIKLKHPTRQSDWIEPLAGKRISPLLSGN